MSRWFRSLALLTMGALLVAGLSPGRAEEEREKSAEPPRYENPIVSLLFLPVTVLLKIAEVVSPDAKGSGGSDDSSEK